MRWLHLGLCIKLVRVRTFLDTSSSGGGSVGLDVGVDVLSSAFDRLQREGEVVLEGIHVPVVHSCSLISKRDISSMCSEKNAYRRIILHQGHYQ